MSKMKSSVFWYILLGSQNKLMDMSNWMWDAGHYNQKLSMGCLWDCLFLLSFFFFLFSFSFFFLHFCWNCLSVLKSQYCWLNLLWIHIGFTMRNTWCLSVCSQALLHHPSCDIVRPESPLCVLYSWTQRLMCISGIRFCCIADIRFFC